MTNGISLDEVSPASPIVHFVHRQASFRGRWAPQSIDLGGTPSMRLRAPKASPGVAAPEGKDHPILQPRDPEWQSPRTGSGRCVLSDVEQSTPPQAPPYRGIAAWLVKQRTSFSPPARQTPANFHALSCTGFSLDDATLSGSWERPHPRRRPLGYEILVDTPFNLMGSSLLVSSLFCCAQQHHKATWSSCC